MASHPSTVSTNESGQQIHQSDYARADYAKEWATISSPTVEGTTDDACEPNFQRMRNDLFRMHPEALEIHRSNEGGCQVACTSCNALLFLHLGRQHYHHGVTYLLLVGAGQLGVPVPIRVLYAGSFPHLSMRYVNMEFGMGS
jgi:hypothetical protein